VVPTAAATPQASTTTASGAPLNTHRDPDELTQELDADAIALSQIPADPLLDSDPLAPILQPFDHFAALVYEKTR
jgi:hypothetical protein